MALSVRRNNNSGSEATPWDPFTELDRLKRTIGRFSYEVTLPGDEDSVEAQLDDGVLTVRVAKAHSERPRRIEIG